MNKFFNDWLRHFNFVSHLKKMSMVSTVFHTSPNLHVSIPSNSNDRQVCFCIDHYYAWNRIWNKKLSTYFQVHIWLSVNQCFLTIWWTRNFTYSCINSEQVNKLFANLVNVIMNDEKSLNEFVGLSSNSVLIWIKYEC